VERKIHRTSIFLSESVTTFYLPVKDVSNPVSNCKEAMADRERVFFLFENEHESNPGPGLFILVVLFP